MVYIPRCPLCGAILEDLALGAVCPDCGWHRDDDLDSIGRDGDDDVSEDIGLGTDDDVFRTLGWEVHAPQRSRPILRALFARLDR